MTTQTTHPLSLSDLTRVEDNARAVEVMLDYTGLPAVTLTPTPTVVHITVTNSNDLSRWAFEAGGRVDSHPAPGGVVLLTLHTATPTRADGTTVPIRVHTIATEGVDVLVEVRHGAVGA